MCGYYLLVTLVYVLPMPIIGLDRATSHRTGTKVVDMPRRNNHTCPCQEREPLATPTELAAYLGCTTQRLADDRYHGTGIPFVRHGRNIRYKWSAVHKWEQANTFVRSDEAA